MLAEHRQDVADAQEKVGTQQKLEELTAMGFEAAKALEMLELSGGDVEAASMYYLNLVVVVVLNAKQVANKRIVERKMGSHVTRT
eukprot:7386201-Prymnesium_polylepis.1